jgi:hypothetical protein
LPAPPWAINAMGMLGRESYASKNRFNTDEHR